MKIKRKCGGSKMNRIKLTVMAVIVIAVLSIIFSGCAGIGDSDFTIKVSGSDRMIFSGAIAITTSAGGSISQSVDGIVPAQYTVRGNIVSVSFKNNMRMVC